MLFSRNKPLLLIWQKSLDAFIIWSKMDMLALNSIECQQNSV